MWSLCLSLYVLHTDDPPKWPMFKPVSLCYLEKEFINKTVTSEQQTATLSQTKLL